MYDEWMSDCRAPSTNHEKEGLESTVLMEHSLSMELPKIVVYNDKCYWPDSRFKCRYIVL